MKKDFTSYKEAKKFIENLNLKKQKEWVEYSKSGNRPENIPSSPNTIYQNKGWVNWGSFLGNGKVVNRVFLPLPYKDVKKFVKKLNLKSQKEWVEYSKSGNRPDNIPSSPYTIYQNKGWTSWGDFLGTGNIGSRNRTFLSFEEARVYARSLNLNCEEWIEYSKSSDRPNNIPSNPSTVYKNKGWINMLDFLGTVSMSNRDRVFLSFEEAKEFARSLGLQSQIAWIEYCKSGDKPINIPSNPNCVYKNKGWTNYGDFWGHGKVYNHNSTFLSFEEAREFVQNLGLKSLKEWMTYNKSGDRPNNIPSHPYRFYKNKGWISYGDFLGNGKISNHNRVYLSFEEAKEFARSLGLQRSEDWYNTIIPDNIPKKADYIYKNNGWISWSDFLGYDKIPFKEAREFVRSLNLKSYGKFHEYIRSGMMPKNIPTDPYHYYKDQGWINWGDFLGTGNIATCNMVYLSFEEARGFVHSLNLKNYIEWKKYRLGKNHINIPSNPDTAYKDKGWINWSDFLGTPKSPIRKIKVYSDQ